MLLLTSWYDLHSVHAGQKKDCSLDSSGAEYQLPDDATEDTDRSDHLFRRPAVRAEILQACDNSCFYCFTPLNDGNWEADHLVPVALGGCDTLDNAVAACRPCNRKKGCLTHRAFIDKYGGKNGISTFVRCHGFSKDHRCKNPESLSPESRSCYCRYHGHWV